MHFRELVAEVGKGKSLRLGVQRQLGQQFL